MGTINITIGGTIAGMIACYILNGGKSAIIKTYFIFFLVRDIHKTYCQHLHSHSK